MRRNGSSGCVRDVATPESASLYMHTLRCQNLVLRAGVSRNGRGRVARRNAQRDGDGYLEPPPSSSEVRNRFFGKGVLPAGSISYLRELVILRLFGPESEAPSTEDVSFVVPDGRATDSAPLDLPSAPPFLRGACGSLFSLF
jgi:hypothetical protein